MSSTPSPRTYPNSGFGGPQGKWISDAKTPERVCPEISELKSRSSLAPWAPRWEAPGSETQSQSGEKKSSKHFLQTKPSFTLLPLEMK